MEPTCNCASDEGHIHEDYIAEGEARERIWCSTCSKVVRYIAPSDGDVPMTPSAADTGGNYARPVERRAYAAQPGSMMDGTQGVSSGTLHGPCIACGVMMSVPSDRILPMKCLPCACGGTPLEPLIDALKDAWDHIPPAGYMPASIPWLQPLINAVSAIVNPSGYMAPVDGIDFVSALASGKPMRRKKWLHHPPTDEKEAKMLRELREHWYLYLSPVPMAAMHGDKPVLVSPWLNIAAGQRMMLTREDYTANDWELL